MKDKFEKIIEAETLIMPIKGEFGYEIGYEIGGINTAAKKCNTLHQQAMKEKLKEQRLNCHADLRRHFMKCGIKFTRVTLKGILDSILNATEPKL